MYSIAATTARDFSPLSRMYELVLIWARIRYQIRLVTAEAW
jgi:hypothetical protein